MRHKDKISGFLSARQRCRLGCFLGAFAMSLAGAAAAPIEPAGQNPLPQGRWPGDSSGMDPAKFFEQFLGANSDLEQKKLESVEITWRDEQRFGNQALKLFVDDMRRKGVDVVSRGREVEYLECLVRELKPRMRNARRYRSIKVLLAETDDTDARCFPGGTLVIFRGLLKVVRSEAALVCILGHELSHIDHGHQLRHLKSMKLAQQTFTGQHGMFDVEKMMGNTMLIANLFARPFRPEDETQADADGVAWAYRIGYDPRELARLFLTMARRDQAQGEQVPMFFRSHPYHRDRYESVMDQYQRLQRADRRDDLYVGQKNLIELVPRSKRRYAE